MLLKQFPHKKLEDKLLFNMVDIDKPLKVYVPKKQSQAEKRV